MFNIFNTVKQAYVSNKKAKRKNEYRIWSRDLANRLRRVFKCYEIDGFEKAYEHTVTEIGKLGEQELTTISRLNDCFSKLKESNAYKITTNDWTISSENGNLFLIHRTPKNSYYPSIYLKIVDVNGNTHEFALESAELFDENIYEHRRVIDNFMKSFEKSVYSSKMAFVKEFRNILKNEYYWEEMATYFDYCMIAAENSQWRRNY